MTTVEKKQQRKFEEDKQEKLSSSLARYPVLAHDELVDLFKVIEKGGKEAEVARKKIIESNLRLVISMTKAYRNRSGIEYDDLFQEGTFGLMKAVEKFDWKKGFRFSTYATWWIRQAMGQYVMKCATIRIPAHAQSVQHKMSQAAAEYKEVFGCEPSIEELTEIVGASETVVTATVNATGPMVSINKRRGDNTEGTLEERIEDDRPGVDPFENISQRQIVNIIMEAMETLTPKEATVLRLRFGLIGNDEESYPVSEEELEQIAAGEGLT